MFKSKSAAVTSWSPVHPATSHSTPAHLWQRAATTTTTVRHDLCDMVGSEALQSWLAVDLVQVPSVVR